MPSARPFPFICILGFGFVLSLAFTPPVFAAAVISEVSWAGSDLSTSDEWLEITGVDTVTSLAGWTVTSRQSSGQESVIFQFPTGATISPDQRLILSHFAAAQSRLFAEPAFISTSISLPNSQLLLKLKDQNGATVDTVDDGSGSPFAGSNTAPKATMERIDLLVSGSDSSNWSTATTAEGFDDAAPMLGTPGFARVATVASSSSSAPISSSSSSSNSLFSSNSSSSCSAFDPYISIQSGSPTGQGKVTLNMQILSSLGSMTSAACQVDFGDGTLSPSCNPSSHTYDRVGSYTVVADVKSACGQSATRTLEIQVFPASGSSSSATSGSSNTYVVQDSDPTEDVPAKFSGSFVLSAVLPNPKGKDAGREWLEITNTGPQTANLEGWLLKLPHGKKSKFTFGNVGFAIHQTKRFVMSELGMSLTNDDGEVTLFTSTGIKASALTWKDAKDDAVFRPEVAARANIKGLVKHVIDGDTIDIELLDSHLTERIRMMGIDAPELHSSDQSQLLVARRAADYVRGLLEGEIVTLSTPEHDRDTYGRLLAYVTTDQDVLMQEDLLTQGLATVYTRFSFDREEEFLEYQREAQDNSSGIWAFLTPSLDDEEDASQEVTALSSTEEYENESEFSSSKSSLSKLSSKSSSGKKKPVSKKKAAKPKKAKKRKAPAVETLSGLTNADDMSPPTDLVESVDADSGAVLSSEPNLISSIDDEGTPSGFPFLAFALSGLGIASIGLIAAFFFIRRWWQQAYSLNTKILVK